MVCVRKENVHHDDEEGAYTGNYEAKDIFSPKLPEFTGYKRTSLCHKEAKKLIEKANSEAFRFIWSSKSRLKSFGIDIDLFEVKSISDLVTVITEGVEAKLATNEPTGK